MQISRIIDVYELGPVKFKLENFTFRIEIHRKLGKAGRFFARIWRYESYRLQPTFPQEQGQPKHEPCDETVIVDDFTLRSGQEYEAVSRLTLMERIICDIAERFRKERSKVRILRLLRKDLREGSALVAKKFETRRPTKNRQKTA